MKGLEHFWKDQAGKSHKSSACSSPSFLAPPPIQDDDLLDSIFSHMTLEKESQSWSILLMIKMPGGEDILKKKLCDPHKHDFPQRDIGDMRRFIVAWFDKYDWLEYSVEIVEKDAAFCFVWYFFKDKISSLGTHDCFVNGGFRGWNKSSRFDIHVGDLGSAHNQATEKFDFFIKPKTSIVHSFSSYSIEAKIMYKSRLTCSLKLSQGLACRGHNESDESWNRGNFLALLTWFSENNSDCAKVVLSNAPGNNQMTFPIIQMDLINSCAKETIKLLINDIGDDYFGILADESSDVSQKEQMALCLRYVIKEGKIYEQFLGIVHVKDTTALTLKSVIETLLMDHSLTLSRVLGQGYDGANNMKGEINGLKRLIMNDHVQVIISIVLLINFNQLLLLLLKDNDDCIWLFYQLAILLNVIGVSCKQRDLIQELQAQEVLEALDLGEIDSGQGLNQEMGLGRPGDTCWGSHYKTVVNVTSLYSTIIKVLLTIGENNIYKEDRVKAITIMSTFESFEFVFTIHLMSEIFGITDRLCQALQRGDQDIVNAMSFVTLTKERLQKMRDHGWEDFLDLVTSFCVKHDIEVLDMDALYVPRGRSKRFFAKVSNHHCFRIELFLSVIDLQFQELDNRFDEQNMELLVCMAIWHA